MADLVSVHGVTVSVDDELAEKLVSVGGWKLAKQKRAAPAKPAEE